jgi:hypothetical protein
VQGVWSMEQRDKVGARRRKTHEGIMTIESRYRAVRKSMPRLGSVAETLVQLANVLPSYALLSEARNETSDQDHLCPTSQQG